VTAKRTDLLLSFDPLADPPSGTIGPIGAPGREFCGYVELIGAVERARAAAADLPRVREETDVDRNR
jgi:hypothetical protein